MQALNLPTYIFKIKSEGQRSQIFDSTRRKYVALTPEEWVRQNYVEFLVQERQFPRSLMAIEQSLTYNRMQRRCDLLAYTQTGQPALMVECKAPNIKIDQKVFDQIARYNMSLQVPYLAVTNGLEHYYCYIDLANRSYRFLPDCPAYGQLTTA
ncbi:MAG: type I restriction enzyme HsdR N-terminal domain-containing protein [Salibacteraceae bacterium]